MKDLRRFHSVVIALFLIAFLFVAGCKTSPPSAPADTAPTVAITSPAIGETCRQTDTVFVSATDDKAVTKVELYINGSLAGTDQTYPYRFIWDTEDGTWPDGSYTLQAKAYDNGGHTTTSASIVMSVYNAFPVTFINNLYTSLSVTILGVTQTAARNDSAMFILSTNPRSLVFTASTSGKTTNGTTVGLTLAWGGQNYPIDVSSLLSVRVIPQVTSTYFFMYMSNSGKTTLGPVYVNYGRSDQTVDYISVPGDGVKYSIGYYKANTGSTVRAYWSSPTTTYSYWTLSAFPNTANQSLWLNNTLPTSKIAADGQEIQPQIQSAFLQSPPTVVNQNALSTNARNVIKVYSHEQ